MMYLLADCEMNSPGCDDTPSNLIPLAIILVAGIIGFYWFLIRGDQNIQFSIREKGGRK